MKNNKKKNKIIEASYKENLVSPDKIPNFQSVINYYLYHSPNLKCIHSKILLGEEKQKEVLKAMFNHAGLNKDTGRFLKRIQKVSLEKLDLKSDRIDINNNRFICKVSKIDNEYETEFESIVRHFRNCFAHGNIACFKGKRMVLKDIVNKEETAVFVLSKGVVRDWKAILENIII